MSGTTETVTPPPGEEVTGVVGAETINFIVYPNPALNVVTIKTKGPETVLIYSNQGKLIRQYSTNGAEEIQFKELPSGIYIIKTPGTADSRSTKLIVE